MTVARRLRGSSFIGAGCVVQALGLLAPLIGFAVLGVLGAVLGLVALPILFIAGSRASIIWKCGACRNPLADSQVRICPVCKADLGDPPPWWRR